MKYYFAILINLIWYSILSAQCDMKGTWDYSYSIGKKNFSLSLVFEKKENEVFYGKSITEATGEFGRPTYAFSNFTATPLKNKAYYFDASDTTLIFKNQQQINWCTKGTLLVDSSTCESFRVIYKDCNIAYFKKIVMVEPPKELKTKYPKITLKFWDNDKPDQDHITIKLNKKVVKKKIELTKEPEVLTFDLTQKDNFFEIIADDVGLKGVNTCTIQYTDGDKIKQFIIIQKKREKYKFKIVFD